jgi:hypothetical protein
MEPSIEGTNTKVVPPVSAPSLNAAPLLGGTGTSITLPEAPQAASRQLPELQAWRVVNHFTQGGEHISRFRLSLDREHLGAIGVVLTLRGSELSCTIEGAEPEVAVALSEDAAALRSLIEATSTNISVASVSIHSNTGLPDQELAAHTDIGRSADGSMAQKGGRDEHDEPGKSGPRPDTGTSPADRPGDGSFSRVDPGALLLL